MCKSEHLHPGKGRRFASGESVKPKMAFRCESKESVFRQSGRGKHLAAATLVLT